MYMVMQLIKLRIISDESIAHGRSTFRKSYETPEKRLRIELKWQKIRGEKQSL